jgi:hypothetical protein
LLRVTRRPARLNPYFSWLQLRRIIYRKKLDNVLPNEADEASDLAYILATVMVKKSRLKFFDLRTYFEAGKALFDLA